MPIQQERFEAFGSLEMKAKQVVEGFITGLHKSPFHGFSVEFAEHRQYNPGESTRHLDWKLYARTEKLFTKRYEEETNLRCQLILDTSPSMFYPESKRLKEGEFSKIQFSCMAAASIMYLLRLQRDAVGLSMFDEQVHTHTPVRSTRGHHRILNESLENWFDQVHPPKGKGTQTAENLHLLAERLHRRSLVVIFTDAFDGIENPDPLFSALQHLRYNKHEVILFHVRHDGEELNLEFENRPYTFIDLEGGEKVKLNPDEIKKAYQDRVKSFEHELDLRCGQNRIDYVPSNVAAGFEQILLPFLMKRQGLH